MVDKNDDRNKTPRLLRLNLEITLAVLLTLLTGVLWSAYFIVQTANVASANTNAITSTASRMNSDKAEVLSAVKAVADTHERDKLEYLQSIRDIRQDIKDSQTTVLTAISVSQRKSKE